MTDNGLISKYINSSYNLMSKKQTPDSEHMNRHFSKEQVQMTNGHIEKSSTLLIIREMQMKTTMIYHLTPARMAITWFHIHEFNQSWIGNS